MDIQWSGGGKKGGDRDEGSSVIGDTSYNATAFTLASRHPGLEIKINWAPRCSVWYRTVKYTQAQALVEDGRTWRRTRDVRTNSRSWTCRRTLASLKVWKCICRGLTVKLLNFSEHQRSSVRNGLRCCGQICRNTNEGGTTDFCCLHVTLACFSFWHYRRVNHTLARILRWEAIVSFFFNWSIVGFQYCVSFSRVAAKSLQSCPTVRPHRQQPTRLHRPWDSAGKAI